MVKSNLLNKEQREAVKLIGCPVLIFAGAGSGKTRVLTEKIAYLVDEIGIPPEHILSGLEAPLSTLPGRGSERAPGSCP